jgi:hypothetical protein
LTVDRGALRGIQRHLEAIYAVRPQPSVDGFVIGDAELEELVEAGVVAAELQGTHEQVLVLPDGDEVSLAVYLSDAVQRSLGGGGTLQDHCHATEGVSHFLLLLWSAGQGRPLRRLDLELQAEIDKASTVLLLDHGATGGRGRRELLRRLFGPVDFGAHLAPHERDRYREAHRVAGRYADRLASMLDDGVHTLLDELRRFYRLPADAKHRHALAA